MNPPETTIYACSSGLGKSGIAVWRVSGLEAKRALKEIAGSIPKPRRASHRILRDAQGAMIDDAIVLFFPGPKSVTGEDVTEFHCHGSPAVAQALSLRFSELGLLAAKAGEFTLRALENGRLDILQAEGLGDLLDAETDSQRRQAISLREGQGSEKITQWRDHLIGALGVLEAAVDFPDEEDIPAEIAGRAMPLLLALKDDLQRAVEKSAQAQCLRDGIHVAIIGPPNAGKSSFLNHLIGEERAIVTDIPGTTRDVISERLQIADRLVIFKDTAGIRDQVSNIIEKIGIDRSRKEAAQADLIIDIIDASAKNETPISYDSAIPIIRIANKSDLSNKVWPGRISLSLRTKDGWAEVFAALEEAVLSLAQPSLFPRQRQRDLINAAFSRIHPLVEENAATLEPEILAEEVRSCLDALDQLEGRRTTEAVLGSIFSSFCIGK